MPPLALRMFFFLLGSASAGCLPLLELSEALRAKAERLKDGTKNKEHVVDVTMHSGYGSKEQAVQICSSDSLNLLHQAHHLMCQLSIKASNSRCWPPAVLGMFFNEGRLGEDSGRGATGWTGLVCLADSLFRLTCLFSNISWTSSRRFSAFRTLACKPITVNPQSSPPYDRMSQSMRRTLMSSDRETSYWLWRFLRSVNWFFSADSRKRSMSVSADSAPSCD